MPMYITDVQGEIFVKFLVLQGGYLTFVCREIFKCKIMTFFPFRARSGFTASFDQIRCCQWRN